jgi:hypothetical protein
VSAGAVSGCPSPWRFLPFFRAGSRSQRPVFAVPLFSSSAVLSSFCSHPSAPVSYGARVCLRVKGRRSILGSAVPLSFSSRWFLGPVADPSCHFSLRVPGQFGLCGGSRLELLLPVFVFCAADLRFFAACQTWFCRWFLISSLSGSGSA